MSAPKIQQLSPDLRRQVEQKIADRVLYREIIAFLEAHGSAGISEQNITIWKQRMMKTQPAETDSSLPRLVYTFEQVAVILHIRPLDVKRLVKANELIAMNLAPSGSAPILRIAAQEAERFVSLRYSSAAAGVTQPS